MSHKDETSSSDKNKVFWPRLERTLLLLTFASIILGVFAFYVDFEDRKQARLVNQATLQEIEASQEERQKIAIAQAWETVTRRSVGNTGKGEALEYLNSHGQIMAGIDVSCATMGGIENWDEVEKTCNLPVWINRADLQGAVLSEASFKGVNFAVSNLSSSNLIRGQLQGANFASATMVNINFIEANLFGAKLYNADLTGANLWRANFERTFLQKTVFRNAHVSGANFTGATHMNTVDFRGVWAWSDRRPTGLENIQIVYCVFDANNHDRMERPNDCVAP